VTSEGFPFHLGVGDKNVVRHVMGILPARKTAKAEQRRER